MNNSDALGMIREARALLRDEQKDNGSRELSLVITKLDEAELWRQRDMQLKAPPIDSESVEESARNKELEDLMVESATEPHQQRVIDEKRDLDDRALKLGNFIGLNPIYKTLDVSEQDRMMKQYEIMCKYSAILGDRIAAFKN